VESNPAAGAERPKLPRRRWRILEPVEVSRVLKAFTDEQAKTVFLTLVLTGIRRSELQALRWGDVDLVENVIKIRDSKSEDGIRSIALSTTLAEVLWQHRRRSNFQGDDEFVFCHPERGTKYRAKTFEDALGACRSQGSGYRGQGAGLPRSAAHGDHERRRRWCEPGRADDEGGALGHEDDEDVPAPRGRCLPRGSCRAREAVARRIQEERPGGAVLEFRST
jgi:hypothetical protein